MAKATAATTLVHRRYASGALLGRGAQGVVLRVVDREAPARALVAKVWRPGAFDEGALAGEFALLARVRAAELVRAHDFGRDDATGAPFLVEDFVDGDDAADYVAGAEPMRRSARLLGVIVDVARALAALHDAGFVHGDLKPAHVKMARATGRAVVLDLGAAVTSARTNDAPTAFTRAYAAPELLAGAPASPASDLFALGAVAWELAAGRADRDGRALREIAPWVAPSVADLVEALLAEHPRDRPSDALDVLRRAGAAGLGDDDAIAARHAPAPIGRERELASVLGRRRAGVRYIVGPSGAGKSLLARDAATRAALAGREARLVAFPCDDAQLVPRLVAFFRGADHAWPFAAAHDGSMPILLALDDLHAAPAELIAALDAHRCRAPHRGPDVIATIRTAPDGAETIALGALDEAPFAELCRALGIDGDDAIAEAARASGRNPGWLVASRGRVPLTRDTLLERLRGLSRAASSALAAIALCGGDASSATCTRMLGDDGATAISELLAASLVLRARRGDVVHLSLSAPALAADVATALASFDIADRVADALLADPEAGPHSLLAAARAPTPPSRRDDLLTQAAARARASGARSEEIDALFALAASPKQRTSALLCRLERLTRDAGTTATHPQVITWLDDAARADATLAPLALRRRAEKAAREGDAATASALVAEAREAARALGDAAGEALALATTGGVALYRADWAAADAAFRDARARLESVDVGDAEELARLDHNFGVVALYRGSVAEAIEAFERCLAAKRRLGDRSGMRSCLLNLGLALAKAARLDEADRALDEALALARSLGQTAGRAWCLAARADVAVRRRDPRAASISIAEAEALGDAAPSAVRADLQLLAAEVALLEGDGRRALGIVARIDASLRADDAMIDARARIAEAAARLAVLPADSRGAARGAIKAARQARRAGLPEIEALALAVVRRARSRRVETAPMPYSPRVGNDDADLWRWLDALAVGERRADAVLDLARWLVRASGAERVFVAALHGPSVERAWGVDLDGLEIGDAVRRIDADLALAARASTEPIYQRDIETQGGRGSRIAITSAAPEAGAASRVLLILEHRFRVGHFDGLAAADAKRWATLGALALRVEDRDDVSAISAREDDTDSPLDATRPPRRAVIPAATTAIPVLESRRSFPSIVGTSTQLRKALARLDAAIDTDLPALVVGETGSGTELFARALHDHGPRAKAPFVAVNCGAIPDALFEAELFGHARGSFTGAERARPGLVARAEGGTLLLDEIGELPLGRQAALLRALESHRFRAVGSDEERPFDVRIVTATNRDLDAAVEHGTFRRDLLFRLNVIEIRVPPLRERPEDIPILARAFLERAGSHAEISTEAMSALLSYDWPGNVRELEHQMQRLAATRIDRILEEHLPRAARAQRRDPSKRVVAIATAASPRRRERATESEERVEVERALADAGGNISLAARHLHLTRHGLKKRMVRLGMRPPAIGDRRSTS